MQFYLIYNLNKKYKNLKYIKITSIILLNELEMDINNIGL